MKKICMGLAAIICIISLLCGCRAPSDTAEELAELLSSSEHADIPSFPDMEYSRPGTAELAFHLTETEAALTMGMPRLAGELIELCYEDFYYYDSMYTLSYLHYCHDSTDSFWSGEYACCDENYSLMLQLMDSLLYACAASPYARQLEEQVFWLGFSEEYSAPENSMYSDEVLSLMQEESRLMALYHELSGSPSVDMGRGEESLDLLMSRAFSEAELQRILKAYYEKYNPLLSDIYISLVQLRQELGRACGYEDYRQMQYEYSFGRDYSPEQAAGYIEDIKRYMVPLYRRVSASEPWRQVYLDSVSPQQLLRALGGAAREMGGDIALACGFMKSHQLYDIAPGSGKLPMSFQTYINDYEAPFIFIDPEGDSFDILTFSHEFGHFTDAFSNYNAAESLDVSEACAQSMEYLMLFYYDEYPGPEAVEMLSLIKLLDTLDMYIQQAMFAEFENIVYSCPPEELSREFLNSTYLQLSRDYGLHSQGEPDFAAMGWIDIIHFFEMPFYTVSYPVSNDCAMQIYALELQERGLGLSSYLSFLPRENPGLQESLSAVGLKSPFAPGRIKEVSLLLEDALFSALSGAA